jgi:hypothetical protein
LVRDLLEGLVGSVYLAASRLDVYSDWQGWDLGVADARRFVCRGSRRDTHEEGEAFTGYEFGRRTTKTVVVRIYDKTLQVRRKGLDWWLHVWGESFNPAERVLRVELELGREGLKSYGVDSAEQAIAAAPRLWAAVTEDWITHRTPTADSTRSRWPTSPEWHVIQGAAMRGDAVGLDRIRQGKQKGELRRTLPQLTGHLAKFAALSGTIDVEDTLAALPWPLADYGVWSGKTFRDRVAEKARDLA